MNATLLSVVGSLVVVSFAIIVLSPHQTYSEPSSLQRMGKKEKSGVIDVVSLNEGSEGHAKMQRWERKKDNESKIRLLGVKVYNKVMRENIKASWGLPESCIRILLNSFEVNIRKEAERVRRIQQEGRLKSINEIEDLEDAKNALDYYDNKYSIIKNKWKMRSLKGKKVLLLRSISNIRMFALEREIERMSEAKGIDVVPYSLSKCLDGGTLVLFLPRDQYFERILENLKEIKWYLEFRKVLLAYNGNDARMRSSKHRAYVAMVEKLRRFKEETRTTTLLSKERVMLIKEGRKRIYSDPTYLLFRKAQGFRRFATYDSKKNLFVENPSFKWVELNSNGITK